MSERVLVLFLSYWFSLFFLMMGLVSRVLCLEELVILDNVLVVLLCSMLSWECGRRLALWSEGMGGE